MSRVLVLFALDNESEGVTLLEGLNEGLLLDGVLSETLDVGSDLSEIATFRERHKCSAGEGGATEEGKTKSGGVTVCSYRREYQHWRHVKQPKDIQRSDKKDHG